MKVVSSPYQRKNNKLWGIGTFSNKLVCKIYLKAKRVSSMVRSSPHCMARLHASLKISKTSLKDNNKLDLDPDPESAKVGFWSGSGNNLFGSYTLLKGKKFLITDPYWYHCGSWSSIFGQNGSGSWFRILDPIFNTNNEIKIVVTFLNFFQQIE